MALENGVALRTRRCISKMWLGGMSINIFGHTNGSFVLGESFFSIRRSFDVLKVSQDWA